MVPNAHSMEQMNVCEVCSFCDHGDRGFILFFFLSFFNMTLCLVGGYQHFGVTYYPIIHTRFDFVYISLLSHSARCLTLHILLDLIILVGLWRSTVCNASHCTVFFCIQSHTLFSDVLSLRSSFQMRDQIANP